MWSVLRCPDPLELVPWACSVRPSKSGSVRGGEKQVFYIVRYNTPPVPREEAPFGPNCIYLVKNYHPVYEGNIPCRDLMLTQ